MRGCLVHGGYLLDTSEQCSHGGFLLAQRQHEANHVPAFAEQEASVSNAKDEGVDVADE